VVGLYLNPPELGLVLSVDQKPPFNPGLGLASPRLRRGNSARTATSPSAPSSGWCSGALYRAPGSGQSQSFWYLCMTAETLLPRRTGPAPCRGKLKSKLNIMPGQ
jgi:hypothetical protein